MQREDTDPWYRQFWPWFIIALPAMAVVAGLYTLWLAMQTSDSLVIRSDDGIHAVTERNTTAEREAARLGLSALVNIQTDTGAVVISLSAHPDVAFSNAISTDSLSLRMRHPTMASRDSVIELLQAIPDANGNPTWAGHFVSAPLDRRYVTLSSGDRWRLSGEWSGESTFRLEAGQPVNGGR
jgi:hypothetical protein